jgi:hypothetical protein
LSAAARRSPAAGTSAAGGGTGLTPAAEFQVIISPTGSGQNYLMPASAAMPVVALRRAVAAHEGVAPAAVKLVADAGLELIDGSALADFYVTPLSTLRLVIVGGGKAAHAPPAPAPAPAAREAPAALTPAPALPQAGAGGDAAADGELAGEARGVITDAEGARSILVSGLPAGDPAATEKAIFDIFARYGAIEKVIVQEEEAADGGAAAVAPRQRAVVVFAHGAHATEALAADGAPTAVETGFAPVALRVRLCANVAAACTPSPADALAAAPATSGRGAAGGKVAAGMGKVLAGGFLAGKKGGAWVKSYA